PRAHVAAADPVARVDPAEVEADAGQVERPADDGYLAHAPLDQQWQRPGHVLGGDGRARLDEQLDVVRAVPRRPHLVGLAGIAGDRRPAGEHDHPRPPRLGQPGRSAHALDRPRTDPVRAVPSGAAAAGNDDRPAHRRRRISRQPTNSVPASVTTSPTALRPWSFDSPAARARISTGISSRRRPAPVTRMSASTSGAPLVYGRESSSVATAPTAHIPLIGSWNGRRRTTPTARRATAVPNRRGPSSR